MSLGGQKRRLCGIAGHDRIDRVGRTVDEKIGFPEEVCQTDSEIICRHLQAVEHATDRIIRCRGGLEHMQTVIVVLDDQVRKGSPGINGKSHGVPPFKSYVQTLPE